MTLDSYKGLKIPNTSIVKKKFYQVPVKYLTKGDNSAKEQFTVRDTSNKGDVTVEQRSFTIYGRTKDYCYLDPEEVGENVVLQAMDSKDTFLIEKMKTLKGVYCTNQGYADFRPIDILIEKDDYSIIANDTNQELVGMISLFLMEQRSRKTRSYIKAYKFIRITERRNWIC